MSLREILWRKGRSGSPGRLTRRRGGARRRPLMEELEPRTVLSISPVLSGTGGADLILIRRAPSNAAAIQVTITQGTQPPSDDVSLELVAGDTLTVNAGDGADTFEVDDTFADVILTLNGEGDDDTFNISPTQMSLDNIDGDVI